MERDKFMKKMTKLFLCSFGLIVATKSYAFVNACDSIQGPAERYAVAALAVIQDDGSSHHPYEDLCNRMVSISVLTLSTEPNWVTVTIEQPRSLCSTDLRIQDDKVAEATDFVCKAK